jgi:hypothetical protein
MGIRLSETELQKSLDFCVKLFNPTTPEEHERLTRSGLVAKELLDVSGPIVDPCVFKHLPVGKSEDHPEAEAEEEEFCGGGQSDSDSDNNFDSDCEKAKETKRVLDKINARRVVHAEYAIHNLESEPLEGYVVHLEKGRLGLLRLEAPSSSSDSGYFSSSISSAFSSRSANSFKFFDDDEVN